MNTKSDNSASSERNSVSSERQSASSERNFALTERQSASSERKKDHINICYDASKYDVQSGNTGFDELSFVHNALPEVDFNTIDTTTEFLGYKLSFPFMISPMTGGGTYGQMINRLCAEVAHHCKIGTAVGSMRALFTDSTIHPHFAMKRYASDIPFIGNIGARQLTEIAHSDIAELCKKLEVDALSVHLNFGQELFQSRGDRSYSGILSAIEQLQQTIDIPLIVKETGFGMSPRVIERLIDSGIKYIDIAGAGGTNWIRVEHYRAINQTDQSLVELFSDWGIPTAYNLLGIYFDEKLKSAHFTTTASGGIRTAMDIAKSLACGAHLTASALPIVRLLMDAHRRTIPSDNRSSPVPYTADSEEGTNHTENIIAYIKSLQRGLKIIMALTGCNTIKDLTFDKMIISPTAHEYATQLAAQGKAETT